MASLTVTHPLVFKKRVVNQHLVANSLQQHRHHAGAVVHSPTVASRLKETARSPSASTPVSTATWWPVNVFVTAVVVIHRRSASMAMANRSCARSAAQQLSRLLLTAHVLPKDERNARLYAGEGRRPVSFGH